MTTNASRRKFLEWSAKLSVAGAATPFALNLASMGAASAQSSGATDYKALVCIFLYGGNDNANTVIPYDAQSYEAYRNARSAVARPRDVLLPLQATTDLGGRQLALPPELAPLQERFNSGRVAIVGNVGPLVQPLNRTQYESRTVPVPPKLFSHNDQQSVWQASQPEGAQYGWGGRLGDILAGSNRSSTFTSISVAGNAVWSSGQSTLQYQVGPGGATPVNALASDALFGSSAAPRLLREMITRQQTNLLAGDHAALVGRALGANQELGVALGKAAAIQTAYPEQNDLAAQLKMVARMISIRDQLGAKRQVFFVSLGGFDHHAFLSNGHPPLLTQLVQAMAAFDQTMLELGVDKQVTTFTASDFGRALSTNGDGSDHGWGAHHFVMGGAVAGKQIYGKFPIVALQTEEDAGQGRLIPSTSVDQYAAAFGRWMGLSDTQLSDVLPGLKNFSGTLPMFG
jgi:uncharacterized protein (DUF1501 family)